MTPAAASLPVEASSLWVLVAVNLVPIAGVAFWGWRVHEIVFLYWVENLVIGAANILRMWTAAPPGSAPGEVEATGAKLMMIGFFMVHYGLFCFGHGTALATLFPVAEGGVGIGSPVGVLVHMLRDPYALAAIGAIVASHAWSYFRNYLGGGEYLRVKPGDLMSRPYKRIAVTHLFLIAGGFGLQRIGSPLLAMVVFIALKIGFDAYYHRKEHGGR